MVGHGFGMGVGMGFMFLIILLLVATLMALMALLWRAGGMNDRGRR